jgi:hypothetical protein
MAKGVYLIGWGWYLDFNLRSIGVSYTEIILYVKERDNNGI